MHTRDPYRRNTRTRTEIPRRNADQQVDQRENTRPRHQRPRHDGPMYRREHREFIWEHLKSVCGFMITPIIDAVGEEEAKGRFLRMGHSSIERFFAIVYDNLKIAEAAAHAFEIDAVRAAEVDKANKAVVNFQRDVDELGVFDHPMNGFAHVPCKGMGRHRRQKIFEWLVVWSDTVCPEHENALIGGPMKGDDERESLQRLLRFAKNLLWLARIVGDIHQDLLSERYREVATDETLPENLKALDAEFRPKMAELFNAYEAVREARRKAKDEPEAFDAAVVTVKEKTFEIAEVDKQVKAELKKVKGQIKHATSSGQVDRLEALEAEKAILDVWQKLCGAVQTRCDFREFTLDTFWISMNQAAEADRQWFEENVGNNRDSEGRQRTYNRRRNGTEG